LSNEELVAVYSCVYDEAYYGDDDVVYGDGDYATHLRAGLTKLDEEMTRRKLS
jgi:hypothetical protein